jgi:hypothetical protein
MPLFHYLSAMKGEVCQLHKATAQRQLRRHYCLIWVCGELKLSYVFFLSPMSKIKNPLIDSTKKTLKKNTFLDRLSWFISFASKNAKKRKKSEKYIMTRNSSWWVTNLRTTYLHISSPSLYQLNYDSFFCFPQKLRYMNCNLNELATFTRYSG